MFSLWFIKQWGRVVVVFSSVSQTQLAERTAVHQKLLEKKWFMN
jgi:hypothetical protein